MGYTLDQLLDDTGIAGIGQSRSMKKTASETASFSKLAERCRKAVDATPEQRVDSKEREFTEKTAAVAVISRTLDEIRQIERHGEQVKTAAPKGFQVETFIKQALDSGHSEDQIAAFLLEKVGGPIQGLKNIVTEARIGHGLRKAERLGGEAEVAGGEAFRRAQAHAHAGEAMSDAHRDSLVKRMRIKLGDKRAATLFGEHPAYRDLPSAKGLKEIAREGKPAPAGAAAGEAKKPQHAVGVNIGGAHMGLSSEQLAKAKKPAALVGAGYLGSRALGAGKKDDDKKKGVVVVNS